MLYAVAHGGMPKRILSYMHAESPSAGEAGTSLHGRVGRPPSCGLVAMHDALWRVVVSEGITNMTKKESLCTGLPRAGLA